MKNIFAAILCVLIVGFTPSIGNAGESNPLDNNHMMISVGGGIAPNTSSSYQGEVQLNLTSVIGVEGSLSGVTGFVSSQGKFTQNALGFGVKYTPFVWRGWSPWVMGGADEITNHTMITSASNSLVRYNTMTGTHIMQ